MFNFHSLRGEIPRRSVYFSCVLPSQIEVIQNAWDWDCGGNTAVHARHGLNTFPYVGVVMVFIFTPGKQEIALLSSCTSWLVYSQDGVLVTCVS